MITIVYFISPFPAKRDITRRLFDRGEFIKVFVDAPLKEAQRCDVKGLYKKVRSGELKNFTGVDSPYEVPTNLEITIDTSEMTPEESADKFINWLKARKQI